MFEAPAFVAGLDDVTVMREPVEQCGRHLGSPNTEAHSAKARLVGNDDRGAFVEPTNQVEQQLTARQRER